MTSAIMAQNEARKASCHAMNGRAAKKPAKMPASVPSNNFLLVPLKIFLISPYFSPMMWLMESPKVRMAIEARAMSFSKSFITSREPMKKKSMPRPGNLWRWAGRSNWSRNWLIIGRLVCLLMRLKRMPTIMARNMVSGPMMSR